MPLSAPTHLSARKQPRQARATITLDAIFEATIQVLVTDGPHRLTTTRVAERAGVSVGTMYQYFPHKQALFYAVNERYLQALAQNIETACRAQHGAPIADMVQTLVSTYWTAKTERLEVTRALYRSVVELDNEPLIAAFSHRVDAATAAMFATAPDVIFADLPTTNLTLLTTIFGTTRSAFERNLPAPTAAALQNQLTLMCIAYLTAIKTSPATAAGQPPPHKTTLSP